MRRAATFGLALTAGAALSGCTPESSEFRQRPVNVAAIEDAVESWGYEPTDEVMAAATLAVSAACEGGFTLSAAPEDPEPPKYINRLSGDGRDALERSYNERAHAIDLPGQDHNLLALYAFDASNLNPDEFCTPSLPDIP